MELNKLLTEYRLFDCIKSIESRYPGHRVFSYKEGGVWKFVTIEELRQIVNKLSCGLLHLGFDGKDYTPEGADKIAIISNNRPEWLYVDLAVQQIGAILIPVYPTTGEEDLKFILNQAEVKCIFVSHKELVDKINNIKENIPTLKHIICFNEVPNVQNWQDLLKNTSDEQFTKLAQIKSKIPRKHLPTIIYTSGTTGFPKGVMLSHSNICSNIYAAKTSLPFVDDNQFRVLSFLPLNHIFEKIAVYIYLYSGMTIYFAESIETIGANILEVKPHAFTCVPRLLEKIYEKILTKASALSRLKKNLFFWSLNLAKDFEYDQNHTLKEKLKLWIASKLIFSKWRAALGNEIKYIVCGGAATQPKILRVFNTAGIPIYEGYGPTENSPVISVNRLDIGKRKIGTVGLPANTNEVKILEDGEIIVKGPSVMQGYYKNLEATQEAIKDGWLYTGDIGVWVENKFLKITDRKKQLLKTSGGKYVSPQSIENKYKESRFIEQIMVIGEGQKFVAALIVPNFSNIKNKFSTHEMFQDLSPKEMIQTPELKNIIDKEIEKYAHLFNHVEQIKKYELLHNDWTVEGGELTPKLSMRRKEILKKYSSAVERIYSS